MLSPSFSKALSFLAVLTFSLGLFLASARAQGPTLPNTEPWVQPGFTTNVSPAEAPTPHAFWDKQNRILFIAVTAASTADFAVTRANVQNGGKELNPVVRAFGGSTPGLAANFAGETVGVIGISYFLHKTGHHKLERMVSMVNIGCSSSAVAYGLAHR